MWLILLPLHKTAQHGVRMRLSCLGLVHVQEGLSARATAISRAHLLHSSLVSWLILLIRCAAFDWNAHVLVRLLVASNQSPLR